MSPPEATPANGPWPVLDARERRVLGVLVEKQKTSKTAESYPMTLNALTTGCNQKSNRDPILNMSEEETEAALARCQKKGLIFRITGSRVDRWRHGLYESWRVDKVDLAVLAELLLRGPQTEGELRGRASRMEPIDDLDALRAVLRPLVTRNLIVYLTPEDRRGAVLTHGFHEPRELEALRARAEAQPVAVESIAASPVAPAPAVPSVESATWNRLETELAELREANSGLTRQIGELLARLSTVEGELRSLRQSLGG
jgi:uncharacterized protein YceH (UPF0502 family)